MIAGKVYIGGGSIEIMANDLDYLIQQYSPTDDKWSSLPPARTPVRWFGLGELNGQLVVVGGMTKQRQVTEKVHTFDGKWKEFLPPMPTARHSPAVFSKPSCLTVVGGVGGCNKHLCSVEIFIPDTYQWHKASPAPSPLPHMTTTVIHNKCYLAECNSTNLKVYQLDVSVHQTRSGSPRVTTAWKDLCVLPYQRSALGSIDDCLISVGGEEKNNEIPSISVFSPTTNTWKKAGDLPDPRKSCTTVLLPTGRLLVLGGSSKVWTVFT